MAMAEEMNGEMIIGSISWQRAGEAGSAYGDYNSFKLYMGHGSQPELTGSFQDNYVSGTRQLVYQTQVQSMFAQPDDWMTIVLDAPFHYNGVDNLVVELEWAGGVNMFFTYKWNTGANRALENKADIYSPTGILSHNMSELMFESASSLSHMTFGAIKASFAPWGTPY